MRKMGFSLVELLVVVAVISLLMGILLPGLSTARQLAYKTKCQTNIRLLQIANEMYQQENKGVYAPSASNFQGGPGKPPANLNRWFGSRKSSNLSVPFDDNGPLSKFSASLKVRDCPSFREFLVGFEAGCGGYGYNNMFVGQLRRPPDYSLQTDLSGNLAYSFANPDQTVMFTDTAFVVDAGLIEYSFTEPPFWPDFPGRPDPSIHFRHMGMANVVWLDGHVSAERMTFSYSSGAYKGLPRDNNIGWFGPEDNSLFDCE